jgi:hypothetical protein
LDTPQIELFAPTEPSALQDTRDIFREYAASLSVDLDFQDFSTELATLPGDYAPPRGAMLLARVDNTIAGCCAHGQQRLPECR